MKFAHNIADEPATEASYNAPQPRGFNTSTAPNRPLRTPDTILRLLPAIFAIPALTLYCIDVADYHQARVDHLVAAPSKRVTVVDGLAIAFLVLSAVIPPLRVIRWAVAAKATSTEPGNGIGNGNSFHGDSNHRHSLVQLTMSPFWWFAVDFSLWMCCLAMACTTFALRTSSKNCAKTSWPEACSAEARGRMKAAGSLALITAVCHQFLWLIPIHMRYDRLFQKEGAWGVDRPSESR